MSMHDLDSFFFLFKYLDLIKKPGCRLLNLNHVNSNSALKEWEVIWGCWENTQHADAHSHALITCVTCSNDAWICKVLSKDSSKVSQSFFIAWEGDKHRREGSADWTLLITRHFITAPMNVCRLILNASWTLTLPQKKKKKKVKEISP